MSAFFVTGAGTGIGKTWVIEGLIRKRREAGREVRALKPVASGFDPADAAASDSGRLLAALGLEATPDALDSVSPWRYAAPLSPDMAAAREGRAVPFDEVVAWCRARIDDAEAAGAELFVEGIGGVMVPLDATHTVLDLIAALGAPSIVVGGSYLGALSHTLTACAALIAADLPIHLVVVSETPASEVPLEETRATLARFLDPVPVEALPFSPPPSTPG